MTSHSLGNWAKLKQNFPTRQQTMQLQQNAMSKLGVHGANAMYPGQLNQSERAFSNEANAAPEDREHMSLNDKIIANQFLLIAALMQ